TSAVAANSASIATMSLLRWTRPSSIMFESVAPDAFTKRSHRIFYQTLPVSITVHVLVAIGALAHIVWRVEFPIESPRLVRAYVLAELPPPRPPAPPPP